MAKRVHVSRVKGEDFPIYYGRLIESNGREGRYCIVKNNELNVLKGKVFFTLKKTGIQSNAQWFDLFQLVNAFRGFLRVYFLYVLLRIP